MDSSLTAAGDGHSSTRMIEVGGVFVPETPNDFSDCGLEREQLAGLALKHAYTVQQFTTDWMIRQLCLPQGLVMNLLDDLRDEKLIEILGETGALTYLFTISGKGRERAVRLMEISGYVGPAPVSLEAYTANLELQFGRFTDVSPERMETILSTLVLSDEAKQVVGLSVMSGRSLLIHGPPGSGKTSIGRLLHNVFEGHLWIPHAIAIGNNIIRLFDPQTHRPVPTEFSYEDARRVDRCWICIERPFVVVGGELTMEGLDLGFDSALNYYEAPLHLKANGGTFLLDDFGRQRVEASQLLNRWIIPLERQVDYLTLKSGQKVEVPVRQTLVISTGMDPDNVIDPAFMRRIGYRLHLGYPSPEQYGQIFEQYASRYVDTLAPGLVERLIERYAAEGRSLRSSEPGELIERARDICRYRNHPVALTDAIMDLAWKGYFGERESL